MGVVIATRKRQSSGTQGASWQKLPSTSMAALEQIGNLGAESLPGPKEALSADLQFDD